MRFWNRAKDLLRSQETVNQAESIFIEGIEVQITRRRGTSKLCLRLEVAGRAKVTAPLRVSQRSIHQFLLDRKKWLLEQNQELEKWSSWTRRSGQVGEIYLFRGEEFALRDAPTVLKRPFLAVSNDDGAFVTHYWPLKALPTRDQNRQAVFENLQNFFDDQAEKYLSERVLAVSDRMTIRPKQLRFRNQRNRWGSCNSRGSVSLNRRLIGAPEWVVDSVIVHEFSHLKHLNHGREFWGLVSEHCSRHVEADQWLEQNHFRLL